MRYFIAYIGNSIDDRTTAKVFMYKGNKPAMIKSMDEIIRDHYIDLDDSIGENVEYIFEIKPIEIED